jgi:hypothetical protein
MEDGKVCTCKEPVMVILRVRSFHPLSNRFSWRYWRFCKHHYDEFISLNGEGFFTHYDRKGDAFDAPVVGWKPVPPEVAAELMA